MDQSTRNRLSKRGVQQLPSPEKLKMLRERLEKVQRPKDMSEEEFKEKVKWIRLDLETLDPSWPPSEELDWQKEMDVMLGELSEMKFHAATRLAFNQEILFQGDELDQGRPKEERRHGAVMMFIMKVRNTFLKAISRVAVYPFKVYATSSPNLKTWHKVLQFFLLVFFMVLPWPFLDPAGMNWHIWKFTALVIGVLVFQMMIEVFVRRMGMQIHNSLDGSPKAWYSILAILYYSTLYFSICYSIGAIVVILY